MAVSSVDGNSTVETTPEAQFDQAVENAQEEQELLDTMIEQAVVLGGQFIIMPRAQEILKEATSDDEE